MELCSISVSLVNLGIQETLRKSFGIVHKRSEDRLDANSDGWLLGILLQRQESNLNRQEKEVGIVNMEDRLVQEVLPMEDLRRDNGRTAQSNSFKHVPGRGPS
ncbi:hypothetical protein NC651_023751 [Populus alba x Populus x berolinensis]|nr:hypothetical protein NC651_023751 [Populus alba x Populus x berolinensis]